MIDSYMLAEEAIKLCKVHKLKAEVIGSTSFIIMNDETGSFSYTMADTTSKPGMILINRKFVRDSIEFLTGTNLH